MSNGRRVPPGTASALAVLVAEASRLGLSGTRAVLEDPGGAGPGAGGAPLGRVDRLPEG